MTVVPSEAGEDNAPEVRERTKVFVHLARGFDARDWERRFESGELIGLNDRTPYGYGRAASASMEIRFSRDEPESRPGRLIRLAVRAVLGFDYLHARRNATAMREADIVWTHTESQFLAVAALFAQAPARPRLLGQSVWLFDHWSRLSPPRRRLYSRLIRRGVDVLTVHSPLNLAVARNAFPDKPVVLVRFGVVANELVSPRAIGADAPVKVLALGNDVHRDWRTAVAALGGVTGVELRIVSGTADARLAKDRANIRIGKAASQADLLAQFDWATAMLIPLKENMHASGITAIQEAVVRGVPVIATRTGGLEAYFEPDEIAFVPPGDPLALQKAVLDIAAQPQAALERARRAQSRMGGKGLGVDAYVARHIELTDELMGERGRASSNS